MWFLLVVALLLSLLVPGTGMASPAEAAACELVLGFKTLHDMIPDAVGNCLANVHYDGVTGDGFQETTAWHGKGGLLVWRKADNWTGFTDGYRTWVNGPQGLQAAAQHRALCMGGCGTSAQR